MGGAFETRLTRELAVLTTLAHLGCATFAQLHALCFPHCVGSTARSALGNLTVAGYLRHSRWMLKQAHGGGQVWTITPVGCDRLRCYGTASAALPEIDLGCPRTTMESDAWRTRLQVRALIVTLILEARRTPFLSSLCVTPEPCWPSGLRTEHPADALFQIRWQEPRVQPPDWLPWGATASAPAADIQYVVYLDRAPGVPPLQWLAMIERRATTPMPCIPVVVLADEERAGMVQRAVVGAGCPAPVRLSTWERLRTGVGHGQWRDGQGHPCGLQPADAAL